MLPYQSRPTQLQPNPEGMAAVGAIVGLLVGGVTGSIFSAFFRPEISVESLADTPEEAMEQADAEAKALMEKWRKWRRWSYLFNGTLATIGAGLGARIGAAPYQKNSAMWGAMIGTGAMRMVVNPIFNPGFGFPGIVTGGVGAYLGAKRAR